MLCKPRPNSYGPQGPALPDWRWLLKREDGPWYPTMRLFRKPEAGNWKAVAESVRGALNQNLGQLST
jgi:hypothetical protein